MKKLISLILAALLLCGAFPAIAEEAEMLWYAGYIDAIDGNPDSVFVRIGNQYGLYGVDGTPVCEPCYGDINTLYGITSCFVATNVSGLNTKMVINQAGEPITEAVYGHIESISEDWLLCVVLSVTEGEDYDYTSWSNEKYIAERYALLYIPEGRIVGSLTREQYNRAEGYGAYLMVEDDNEAICAYDSAFQPRRTTMNSIWDNPFTTVNEAVVNRITGETIAAGYTSAYLLGDELLLVKAKRRAYGLMDQQGNLMLDTDFDSISYNSSAKLFELDRDDLKGIYDAEINAYIPCAYGDILGKIRVDDTTYYCVEVDGKVGYINAEGEVTCPIAYSKNAVTILGASMFAADLDGTIKLIAADGTITPLAGIAEAYAYTDAAQGRYLRVKNAQNKWGIMDWHGQLVFDYIADYASAIVFVSPTHFIYANECVYGLN